MTCDVARNRLLALPDPMVPTDDLLPHLAGCALCRTAQAEAARLDGLLKRLPVPSPERKAAFLNHLTADGPVIRNRPVVPSSLTGSGTFKPVVSWLKRIDWRYVGSGVAAVVVIGLGLWALAPKDGGQAKADPPEKPKSERFARLVGYTNELATSAHTPQDRVGVYANWTDDLKGEAFDVYKVAKRDEMNSLAKQYESVVSDGVVKHARKIDDKPLPPDVRSRSLTNAMKKLADAETEAARLAVDAPPDARDALTRIARTAQDGRRSLADIAEGKR